MNKIPYEKVSVRLAKLEHLDEGFGKINPRRQVPAMKHGDFCLPESNAIMKYLHRTFNCPDHWYPEESKSRAMVDSILDWHHVFRASLAPCVFKSVFAKMFGLEVDKAVLDMHFEMKDKALKDINKMLGNSKYLCGDHLTIADINSFCEVLQLGFIEEDFSHLKNLKRWYDEIFSLDEVQKVSKPILTFIDKSTKKRKAKL